MGSKLAYDELPWNCFRDTSCDRPKTPSIYSQDKVILWIDQLTRCTSFRFWFLNLAKNPSKFVSAKIDTVGRVKHEKKRTTNNDIVSYKPQCYWCKPIAFNFDKEQLYFHKACILVIFFIIVYKLLSREIKCFIKISSKSSRANARVASLVLTK